jgi:hypothetical protein
VRDVVLMGSNVRYRALRSLSVEAERIAVTFDIAVLLALKETASPAQNSLRRGKGRRRFAAP